MLLLIGLTLIVNYTLILQHSYTAMYDGLTRRSTARVNPLPRETNGLKRDRGSFQ